MQDDEPIGWRPGVGVRCQKARECIKVCKLTSRIKLVRTDQWGCGAALTYQCLYGVCPVQVSEWF